MISAIRAVEARPAKGDGVFGVAEEHLFPRADAARLRELQVRPGIRGEQSPNELHALLPTGHVGVAEIANLDGLFHTCLISSVFRASPFACMITKFRTRLYLSSLGSGLARAPSHTATQMSL